MAEGTRVLTRVRWSGTHQDEFLGIPSTHRVVQVWGMVMDRFEGDKVRSTRLLMDTVSLLQQLGVVPSVPEAGADRTRRADQGMAWAASRVRGAHASSAV